MHIGHRQPNPWRGSRDLTPNPFPLGKGNRIRIENTLLNPFFFLRPFPKGKGAGVRSPLLGPSFAVASREVEYAAEDTCALQRPFGFARA